jgi:hypothetical protein
MGAGPGMGVYPPPHHQITETKSDTAPIQTVSTKRYRVAKAQPHLSGCERAQDQNHKHRKPKYTDVDAAD